MTNVPPEAAAILNRATLCYLAVAGSPGPHLTPVVFAFDGGRLWVTTARGSVKARAWRRNPGVAGLVRGPGGDAVSFRGLVTAFDLLDPSTWVASALAGPAITRAAARFTLKNARFFAGYAADARRVPLAWTPPGRVFAAIEPLAGHALVGAGSERGPTWGLWPNVRGIARRPPAPGKRRMLDEAVPEDVRAALGTAGDGAIALDNGHAVTVLPAAWRRIASRGAYRIRIPSETLALAGAGRSAATALTVDVASTWRAADMRGMLLQGPAEVDPPRSKGASSGSVATLHLLPRRVVWWEGWTSGRLSDEREGRA